MMVAIQVMANVHWVIRSFAKFFAASFQMLHGVSSYFLNENSEQKALLKSGAFVFGDLDLRDIIRPHHEIFFLRDAL